MEFFICGWKRKKLNQCLLQRPLREMEHRSDQWIIPTGCTVNVSGGIQTGFKITGAVLTAKSEYLGLFTQTDDDLITSVKRRFGIDLREHLRT